MLKRMPKTLALRLTLWYAGIFIVFTATAFIIFYLSIGALQDRQIHEDLEDDIEEFRSVYLTEGDARFRQELQREVLAEDQKAVFFRLLGPDGRVEFSSSMEYWDEHEINRLPSHSDIAVIIKAGMAEEDETASMISAPLGNGYQLQVGESLEDKNDFMELLLTVFGGTFLLSIPLGALSGWFMAQRALRGITEVTSAAADVAQGKLDRQVEIADHGEEINRLAEAFNRMVERLNHLVSGMREMTDNIAHDLRSPLGRIRMEAEQALSGASSTDDHKRAEAGILEECDRLLHMINTTLDVAETEAGVADLDKHTTDVSRIVQDACELYETLAEDKGIIMQCEVEDNCQINANTPYLQRMLGNLLDNALKYSRPNGKVDVKLEKNGRQIYIQVADNGVGIEEQDQHRVFNRFYRCDMSRSEPGCGLGLSLARAIARAHGGDINLDSRPGNGTTFTVSLPV